ncbi:CLUMA_CG011470, isoform A [Clunio marinus]|uniref:Serine/threonine-protein phosphatase n=1 Tax=Clunio marinus TaxID=568069 RepID=A0A1J1IGC9_9DIPT|nr:CLUMA_CG011470, isoform A [Clunio marinus]
MLRSCICLKKERRDSQNSSTSSCRSSEIERNAAAISNSSNERESRSLMKFLSSSICFRVIRSPRRGLSMTKVERVIKATLLIQRWYRRYMARVEMKRRYTWTIFQNIEYSAEQDQVRLYNFFNDLLMHMPEAAKQIKEQDQMSTSSAESLDDDFLDESDDSLDEGIDEPKVYKGPHLNIPFEKQDLDMLINLFRKRKYKLHARYVAMILREGAKKLRRLDNINKASTEVKGSKTVTVVGDLHGKLDDLLVILYKNGLPSHTNCYVFNGDFVDRGKKSLEVLLILLVCFIIFPGCVMLNRGNHEDAVMNHRYGFTREVHQKYRHNADKLLKLIDQVYRHLPLGTLINNKIFVVHGGISESTDLNLIASVRRSKYVSILRPPTQPKDDSDSKIEWKQVIDILWSDPVMTDAVSPMPNKRGAGECFGPETTNKFLQRHNLTTLVRSHECKSEGYEIVHNGNVITVFSASNYYEIGSNKGAYIKFGANSDRYFVQFTAAASKTRKLTFRQQVDNVEKSAIRELKEKLREQKTQLQKEFKERDSDNTGRISLCQWSEAMEAVTNFKLPWRLLREKLATVNKNNEIVYSTTLQMIEEDDIKIVANGTENLIDTMYTNRENLEAIFRMMDLDSNGLISIDEFKQACELLSGYLPNYNVDQMLENCRMMDMNKDSHVDLNEFLEAFRLCQQFHGSKEIEKIPSKEGSARCLINNSEDDNEKVEVQVDEYEISEMKECLNTGGQLKKSPSIRSVVSVESLGQTGQTQDQKQEVETDKIDNNDDDGLLKNN